MSVVRHSTQLTSPVMPIPFTCPYCDQETLVDERYAGYEGPCVNCGRTVTVPSDAPRIPAVVSPRPLVKPVDAQTQRSLFGLAILAFAASVIGIGMLVVGPAIGSIRSVALQRRCAGNLRQLALALEAYEQDHGTYPPAFVVGPDGKPWHSWRVLVLPYLGAEQKQLYDRYDLAQPWDSKHNSRLFTSMPAVFASPADPDAERMFETSYVAVAGPGMAMVGGRPTSSTQIADGLADTVLLVEVRGAGIGWTQPRDLDARTNPLRIGTDLGGNHKGGVNVVTADGQTHFLPDTLSPQEVHALLTAAGGEGVSVTGN